MSNLYWLSEDQMAQLRSYFPKSHGVPPRVERHYIHKSQRLAAV